MASTLTISIPDEIIPYITKDLDEKKIIVAIAFYNEYLTNLDKIQTDVAEKDGFIFGAYITRGPGPNPYEREAAYDEYYGRQEAWKVYKILTKSLEVLKIKIYNDYDPDTDSYEHLYRYSWKYN